MILQKEVEYLWILVKNKIRMQGSQLSQIKTNKWDSCVQYMNGATCKWVWIVNVITSDTLEAKNVTNKNNESHMPIDVIQN